MWGIWTISVVCAASGLLIWPILRARMTTSTGYLCTICGASRTQLEYRVGALTWRATEEVSDSAITRLRAEFIGPCPHDWAFDWANEPGGHADAFAHREHPVGQLPKKLAEGLRRFGDEDSVRTALRAIGNKRNKLRWLAAATVMSLAYGDEHTLTESRWRSWWAVHRDAFVVHTDVASALEVARRYLGAEDGLVDMGAQEVFLRCGAWPP